jgi:RNA polymerase sigma-70 factor (ECF subfamily)
VTALADAHRELVMLIHWDGLTLVEAAEIQRLNASTARGRYAAARCALGDALAEVVGVV